MSDTMEATGTVWAVFAHRMALATEHGRILVDVGPEGAKGIAVAEGDRITVQGRRKPSELKVERIVTADGSSHVVAWPEKAKPDPHRDEADPAIALKAAEAAGYAVQGEPKRKPKHWEVSATRGGQDVTLHVKLDGTVKKVEARNASDVLAA